MTGIALPGGGVLYGEDINGAGLCGAPGGTGVLLPGGGSLYGLTPCGDDPIPDVLQDFLWLAYAPRDRAWRMTDQISGTAASHATPQADNQSSGAYPNVALVGQMGLDGGTTPGEWITDLDFEWQSGVLEHVSIQTGILAPMQIMYVVDGGDASLAWVEVNYVAQPDGLLYVYLDAGGPGAPRFNWLSTHPVGSWRNGLRPISGRLTVNSTSGAVSLWIDGDLVDTDIIPEHAFPEPPDNTPVYAGPSTTCGGAPVQSFTLYTAIDGDPLYSFDAADPTGWTERTGTPTTAPTRTAYVGVDSTPYQFAADTVFDLPADENRSIVLSFRPIVSNNSWVDRNAVGIFGGQAGWAIAKFDGFAVPYAFIVSSGGAPIVTPLGTLEHEDQTVIVTVDRDTATLTCYVDNVLTGTNSIAALGAVAPSAPQQIGTGASWIYMAGAAGHVLSSTARSEIGALFQ